MNGRCHSPARPSLRHVSAGADGGWVLEPGVWRADPGRGLLLAAKREPEGMGVQSSTSRNVCGRSPGHHCSPLAHAPAPASLGTRRGSCLSRFARLTRPGHGLQEQAHSPPPPPPPPQPKQAHMPHPLQLPPSPPPTPAGWHLPHLLLPLTPPTGAGSGEASGTDTGGRPTCRGGAETTAEPHGPCN